MCECVKKKSILYLGRGEEKGGERRVRGVDGVRRRMNLKLRAKEEAISIQLPTRP